MDHAQRNQESYDRIAAEFLARNGDRSVLHSWMRRFAARVPAGGLVLDLGSGPGHDSPELRSFGLRVVSVDRSRQMLNLAAQRFPGPRVQADLRHLPFQRNSVSAVWASASLLHLDREELGPALAGIADTLFGAGVLFMSVKEGIGAKWETSSYGVEVPRWFTYWTEQDIDSALGAAGFEVIEAATEAGRKETWIIRIALSSRGTV